MKQNFVITNYCKDGLMPNLMHWNNMYLYYEDGLRVSNGENYLLLGQAYNYLDKETPVHKLDQINENCVADIEELSYAWGGAVRTNLSEQNHHGLRRIDGTLLLCR